MKKVTGTIKSNYKRVISLLVTAAFVLTVLVFVDVEKPANKAIAETRQDLFEQLDNVILGLPNCENYSADVTNGETKSPKDRCYDESFNSIKEVSDNANDELKTLFKKESLMSSTADDGIDFNSVDAALSTKLTALSAQNELQLKDDVKNQIQQEINDIPKLKSLSAKIKDSLYASITDEELQLSAIYYSTKVAAQLALKKASDFDLGDPNAYVIALRAANVYDQNGNPFISGISYLNAGGYVAKAEIKFRNEDSEDVVVCDNSNRKALGEVTNISIADLCEGKDIKDGAVVSLGAKTIGTADGFKDDNSWLTNNLSDVTDSNSLFVYKESSSFYAGYLTRGVVGNAGGRDIIFETIGSKSGVESSMKAKANDAIAGAVMLGVSVGMVAIIVVGSAVKVLKNLLKVDEAGGWAKALKKLLSSKEEIARVETRIAEVAPAVSHEVQEVASEQAGEVDIWRDRIRRAVELEFQAGGRERLAELSRVRDRAMDVLGDMEKRWRVVVGIQFDLADEFCARRGASLVDYLSRVNAIHPDWITESVFRNFWNRTVFPSRTIWDRMLTVGNLTLREKEDIEAIRMISDSFQHSANLESKYPAGFHIMEETLAERFTNRLPRLAELWTGYVYTNANASVELTNTVIANRSSQDFFNMISEAFSFSATDYTNAYESNLFFGALFEEVDSKLANLEQQVSSVVESPVFIPKEDHWVNIRSISLLSMFLSGAPGSGFTGVADANPIDPFSGETKLPTMDDKMNDVATVQAANGKRLAPVEHIAFSALTFIHATPVVHYKHSDDVEHTCVFATNDELDSVPTDYSTLQFGVPDVLATNCQSELQDNDEIWITSQVDNNGKTRDKNPDETNVRHFTYAKHSGVLAAYIVQGKLTNEDKEYFVAYTTNILTFTSIMSNFVAGNTSSFFENLRNIIGKEKAEEDNMYNLVLNNSVLHSYATVANDEIIKTDVAFLSSPFVSYDQFVKYEKDDREFTGNSETATKESLLAIYLSASALAQKGEDVATNNLLARNALTALKAVVVNGDNQSKLTFDESNYESAQKIEDVRFVCSPEANPNLFINGQVKVPAGQDWAVVNCIATRKLSGVVQNFYLSAPDARGIVIGGSSNDDCQAKSEDVENSNILPVTFTKKAVTQNFTICVSKNDYTNNNLIAVNTRNSNKWTEYHFALDLLVTHPLTSQYVSAITEAIDGQQSIATDLESKAKAFEEEMAGRTDEDGNFISKKVADIIAQYTSRKYLTDEEIQYLCSVGFTDALSLGRVKLLSTVKGYSAESQINSDDAALLAEFVPNLFGSEEPEEEE